MKESYRGDIKAFAGKCTAKTNKELFQKYQIKAFEKINPQSALVKRRRMRT